MLVVYLLLCLYLQSVIAARGMTLFGLQRVCLCRCGVSRNSYSGSSRTGRLPKEHRVSPHEYPWLAAVNIGQLVVAGSLISDRHVLTAASPLYGLTPDHITITLGAHDRCAKGASALNITVETAAVHPGFSPATLDNDIALIKLKHEVAFTKYIAPICLPYFGSRDSEQVTWTVGWSQNKSGSCTPQVAVLPTVPSAVCFKDDYNKLASDDKGCLGPLGVKSVICQSDVGSPVMTRWSTTAVFRLIGVVSTSSCEDTATPLFTRVNDHVEWIFDYIRRDCLCF